MPLWILALKETRASANDSLFDFAKPVVVVEEPATPVSRRDAWVAPLKRLAQDFGPDGAGVGSVVAASAFPCVASPSGPLATASDSGFTSEDGALGESDLASAAIGDCLARTLGSAGMIGGGTLR